MKMRKLPPSFCHEKKITRFVSADENMVATCEVYWPVSGRLNTPSGRPYHTLCFLIISNSSISFFSRITPQLYNGRVNLRAHQNITFYFLQLIHIERLINTSTSGYQKTIVRHWSHRHWSHQTLVTPDIDHTVCEIGHWSHQTLITLDIDHTGHWSHQTLITLCVKKDIDHTGHWSHQTLITPCVK